MREVRQQLDIYNPAEFYAALGLLTMFSLQHREELNSHFDVLGHQGEDNTAFVVSSDADLCVQHVMNDLAQAKVAKDMRANVWSNPKEKEKAQLVCPVVVSSDGWSITLDWWLDELRYQTNNLKLWSGNSNPADMLQSFIRLPAGCVNGGGTVFGFDTRGSRDSLAVGFSRHDTREKAPLYPQTELLCAVGLQHYRPLNQTYYAWHEPIPLSISHAAAVQEIPGVPQTQYEFEVRKIGQGAKEVIVPERYKFAEVSEKNA